MRDTLMSARRLSTGAAAGLLVACGGGGGSDEVPSADGYAQWEGNANGSIVKDASNDSFEVLDRERVLVQNRSVRLPEIQVDSEGVLTYRGAVHGAVVAGMSTSGRTIAVLECLDGTPIDFVVNGSSWTWNCSPAEADASQSVPLPAMAGGVASSPPPTLEPYVPPISVPPPLPSPTPPKTAAPPPPPSAPAPAPIVRVQTVKHGLYDGREYRVFLQNLGNVRTSCKVTFQHNRFVGGNFSVDGSSTFPILLDVGEIDAVALDTRVNDNNYLVVTRWSSSCAAFRL
jgi:hypothetical protein